MNVLIADDEKIVLEGLKYIIDWNSSALLSVRQHAMVRMLLRKSGA